MYYGSKKQTRPYYYDKVSRLHIMLTGFRSSLENMGVNCLLKVNYADDYEAWLTTIAARTNSPRERGAPY